jgi:arylsulfatase A-like enzyme
VTRHPWAALAATVFALTTACSSSSRPVDLLRAEDALVEATAATRGRDWIMKQWGRQVRINDVVVRTLPASPRSRLRFSLRVPKRARLTFYCGIAPEKHERPAVEFAVKVKPAGKGEDTVFASLVDPMSRPAHRRWVPAEVDLAKYGGRDVDLILETRGFEESDEPFWAYWGAPALTTPQKDAPLVILYLVDTLRADHTQPYGYSRDTTPELLRFASGSVVFEKAISHASWTKPAVASIMTSVLPGRHRAVQLRDPLDAGHVTLAEMLSARGFATGAAVANSVIYGAGVNFEQGFDHFAGLHGAGDRPSKVVDTAKVVDEALSFLRQREGFPTFLYVHTMDPHVPYSPPPPFDQKYEPHPLPDHPAADPRSDYKEPLDRERLIAQYDGAVAYGDQQFGRLVAELKKRGVYDRALIVFIADHGDEFQDHGQWTHGKTVFDELIHVPLIVKFPGGAQAGKRVSQQVQSADVLPTILETEGLPVPRPPVIIGHPLQAVLKGGAPEVPVVAEISHRGFVAHGLRTARDKYVRRFSPQEDELYFDLLSDPKELSSRLEERSERVRMLRAAVEAAMVPNPFRHNVKVEGSGTFRLKLKTAGWIEGVQAVGLGPQERYQVESNGRRLSLDLQPKPGRPREVSFSVRPMGAPVQLEATRDGRDVRPSDVWIAEEGVHPKEGPLALPEVEPVGEDDKARLTTNIFAAPSNAQPGIHLWLTMTGGLKVMDKFDKETCEALKALGYIGTCPG